MWIQQCGCGPENREFFRAGWDFLQVGSLCRCLRGDRAALGWLSCVPGPPPDPGALADFQVAHRRRSSSTGYFWNVTPQSNSEPFVLAGGIFSMYLGINHPCLHCCLSMDNSKPTSSLPFPPAPQTGPPGPPNFLGDILCLSLGFSFSEVLVLDWAVPAGLCLSSCSGTTRDSTPRKGWSWARGDLGWI